MADVQLNTLGSTIKVAYEAETNTNAFLDAEKTKLTGIETAATADQTGAEIKVAYELEADTNAYDDAAVSKLTGIETAATADQTGAEIKTLYDDEGNTVNTQTGTAYTLVIADLASIVTMDNAAANTLTVPLNATVAFPIGAMLMVVQLGAGVTTIAGVAGVTLTGNGGSVDTGSGDIQTRYNGATLTKIATDQWVVAGDITAIA